MPKRRTTKSNSEQTNKNGPSEYFPNAKPSEGFWSSTVSIP